MLKFIETCFIQDNDRQWHSLLLDDGIKKKGVKIQLKCYNFGNERSDYIPKYFEVNDKIIDYYKNARKKYMNK